jgi:hypothetical protein
MLMPAIRAIDFSLAEPPRLQKSAAFYGKLPSQIFSALPLLVALVRADHEHHAATADDLAVLADLFDGRTNFHDFSSGPCGPRVQTAFAQSREARTVTARCARMKKPN